jgi:hypothetical protein
MSRKERKNELKAMMDRAFAKGAPHEQQLVTHDAGKTTTVVQPVAIRSMPIMFGVPMDEVMFSRFFVMFYRNVNFMPWDSIATSMGTLVATARNEIHNAFLSTDIPYLMMLDSDVMFPPQIVEKLLKHDKPIVGGYYLSKATQHLPVVVNFQGEGEDGLYHWENRKEPGEGLEQVDGTGAGCWLMRHDVAEALGENPYSHDKCGEDLMVCKKLMDLKIPLYVDWSIRCAHLGVTYV